MLYAGMVICTNPYSAGEYRYSICSICNSLEPQPQYGINTDNSMGLLTSLLIHFISHIFILFMFILFLLQHLIIPLLIRRSYTSFVARDLA